MPVRKLAIGAAIPCSLLLAIGTAVAAPAPTGVWIDPDGRGAVEITECGGKVCGHVVWLRDARDAMLCGTQVLGDLKPGSRGSWTGGWVYDPDDKTRYNVELRPAGDDQLR